MEYRRINMFLPTYKRVINERLLKHLSYAFLHVSDPKNIVYTFLVNEGDTETLTFFDSKPYFPCEHEVLITQHISKPHLGIFYNEIHDRTKFRSPDTLVSMVGDDMIWTTFGYDQMIISTANANDGKTIIHCDDVYFHRGSMCVNLFISERVIEDTGKPYMCNLFPVDFIDVVWTEVGEQYI